MIYIAYMDKQHSAFFPLCPAPILSSLSKFLSIFPVLPHKMFSVSSQVIDTLLLSTFTSWKAFFPLVRDDSDCTYTFITGEWVLLLRLVLLLSLWFEFIYLKRLNSTKGTMQFFQFKIMASNLFWLTVWRIVRPIALCGLGTVGTTIFLHHSGSWLYSLVFKVLYCLTTRCKISYCSVWHIVATVICF